MNTGKNCFSEQVAHWSLPISNQMLFCIHFFKTYPQTLCKSTILLLMATSAHLQKEFFNDILSSCYICFLSDLKNPGCTLGAVGLSSLKVGLQLRVTDRLSLQGWYFIVWHSSLWVDANTSPCLQTGVR